MTQRAGHDLFVYGLGSVLTQSAVVLLTPVLSRELGPSGYGRFELLLVGLNLLSMVVISGLDTSALQQFYVADDDTARRRIFTSGLVWNLAVGASLGAVAFAAATPLSRWLLSSEDGATAIRITAVTLPIISAWRFSLEALRARRRAWRYLSSVVIASALQLALTIWFVALRDGGVNWVMAAWLISAVVALAYDLAAASSMFGLRVDMRVLRRLLRLGVPLLATGLAGWSVMFVDRIVLSQTLSISEVGIYALANKISLVLTLVIYSFNRGWTPHALEVHAHDAVEGRRLQVRSMTPYLAAVAWLAVGASLLAPVAVDVLGGNRYAEAVHLIPVLAVAFLLVAPMPILQITMLVAERTSLLAWPAIAAAVVNLVGVIVLSSTSGLMGASIATAIGFLVQLVLTAALARRLDAVAYPAAQLARLMVLTGAAVAAAWLPSTGVWIGLRVLLAVGFPAVLVAGGAASVGEIRSLLQKPTGCLVPCAE